MPEIKIKLFLFLQFAFCQKNESTLFDNMGLKVSS